MTAVDPHMIDASIAITNYLRGVREAAEAIAKATCPFCGGGALKTGQYDVAAIEPVAPVVRSTVLASTGEVVQVTWWEHRVIGVDANGATFPVNQACLAARAWDAVAPLIAP
jgi:hypothetical protein